MIDLRIHNDLDLVFDTVVDFFCEKILWNYYYLTISKSLQSCTFFEKDGKSIFLLQFHEFLNVRSKNLVVTVINFQFSTIPRDFWKWVQIHMTCFTFTSFQTLKKNRNYLKFHENFENECKSIFRFTSFQSSTYFKVKNHQTSVYFVVPVGPFHIQFQGESAKSCHFAQCQVRSRLEDFLWRKYVLGSRWPRITTLTCPMGCIPPVLKSQKYIYPRCTKTFLSV